MPRDSIDAGVLRHLERADQDPAIRELARDLLAGRLTPRGALRSHAGPLAALGERAMANWRSLTPEELRHHQEQAAALAGAGRRPPPPPRHPAREPGQDAWVDRGLFG